MFLGLAALIDVYIYIFFFPLRNISLKAAAEASLGALSLYGCT